MDYNNFEPETKNDSIPTKELRHVMYIIKRHVDGIEKVMKIAFVPESAVKEQKMKWISRRFNNPTRIICGFDSTGKSTLLHQIARTVKNPYLCVDMERLPIFRDEPLLTPDARKRRYFDDIDDKIEDGARVVCVPYGPDIQIGLSDRRKDYILVYPSLHLKEEYLSRLFADGCTKSHLDAVESVWDKYITGMEIDPNHIRLRLRENQLLSSDLFFILEELRSQEKEFDLTEMILEYRGVDRK